LSNLGFNEYNFERTTNRNTTLEEKNRQSLSKKNEISHQPTKKNTNLNYDIDKNLILEMETENRQTKDILTITPNGLVNSFRTKNDNDDLSVYFGYKSPDDEIDGKIDYYLPITIAKSKELNSENNNESENNNNSISKNYEKIKSAFFKIFYDYDKHIYYLIDLGVGFGTFYKIEEETILKEKSIVNIGESYLIFSFRNKEMETEEQFTDDDLILKIYSNGQEYEPIIIQSNDRVYQVGRSDKCDVYIKDRMLSRIHCLLVFIDNNWYIKDGNENQNESTNGTWMFANEETEIKEGMKFKSNSCNFICKFQ